MRPVKAVVTVSPAPLVAILPLPAITIVFAAGVAVPESVPNDRAIEPVPAISIPPAEFVIVIPAPWVKFAATGGAPVDPISSCPSVSADVHPIAAAVPVPYAAAY